MAEEGVTESKDKRLTFENVLPCTEYEFHVRGWTSVGNGTFSQIQNMTTPSAAPGRPVSVNKINSTTSSLTFSWELPSCENRHGTILGFLYQFIEEETEQVVVKSGATEANITTAILDGLQPCSKYCFKVRAWTSAGNGSFSSSAEGVTETPGER